MLALLTPIKNLALAQSGDEVSGIKLWRDADYAQRIALAEQETFSKYAAELESKITNRDMYLTSLLQQSAAASSDDSGGETFTSECVIATAAFGSNLAPQVQFLRDFRDGKIKSTDAGSSFLAAFNLWYYSFSPGVAEYEREQPWLQGIVRVAIVPLLSILQLSELGYSLHEGELGAITAGFIASSLIGIVYFSPFAVAALARRVKIVKKGIMISFIAACASVIVIAAAIFLELDNVVLMVGTSGFVLGTMIVSTLFMVRILAHRVGHRWPAERLFNGKNLVASAALIALLAIGSQIVLASPASSGQPLSREEIEGQLQTLAETKSWLEETRRIESLFPTTVQVQGLTAWLIGVQDQGGTVTEQEFSNAFQFASETYQTYSSTVYSDSVADRHFTIKDTISSAILQLSYSTADVVKYKTCEICDAQQNKELLDSSLLALETSTQNFFTYSNMLSSESAAIQRNISDIDLMPNSS